MNELNDALAFEIDDVTASKYLNDITEILANYSWIYNVRNTDILIYKVLENIPESWCEPITSLSVTDFCQIPFNFVNNDWPSTLISFIKQCQHLGSFRFPLKTVEFVRKNIRKTNYMPAKVSVKKKFEIDILADLIDKVCQDLDCRLVLDIGSGLGYLDQALHHRYRLNCIGLDSSAKNTKAARNRIKKDLCYDSMQHRTFEVTHSEKCLEELKAILSEKSHKSCPCSTSTKLSSDSVVMVGLHSCGNLTQDMMKLFCQMDEIVAFVCVGCCYNKINPDDFPMSKAAQSVVTNTRISYPEWHPCVSGLRLAAHGTRSHSVDSIIDSHTLKSMFYRALLEYYIREKNIIWHQPKRHIRFSDLLDFETYCKSMFKGHYLSGDENAMKKLIDMYSQKEYLFSRVRILLLLQILLQPLWESFVTLDRMLYFRENSMSAHVLALWDDSESSRNLALCVHKR